MDQLSDADISAALLAFHKLSRNQRRRFMIELNHFNFASAQRQVHMAIEWLRLCSASNEAVVQRVAEDAASYLVEGKDLRRRR